MTMFRGDYEPVAPPDHAKVSSSEMALSAEALAEVEAALIYDSERIVESCLEAEMERLDDASLSSSFAFSIRVEADGRVSDVETHECTVTQAVAVETPDAEDQLFEPCIRNELARLELDPSLLSAPYVHTYVGVVEGNGR